MLDFSSIDTWLGIMVFVVIVAQFGLIIYLNRQNTNLTQVLTDFANSVQSNTKALDLVEKVATQVVPAWLVKGANSGMDFLKELTPDDQDKLIDALRSLFNEVTDGAPNEKPGTNFPAA